MSEDNKRKNIGLGRGLSALLGEDNKDYAALDKLRTTKEVPIDCLRPNRYQPRQHFDEEKLDELTASIRELGILQPLVVRRLPDEPNHYEIIAGERRWRAAQRARAHDVPVVIKDFTEAQALEAALIENIQRHNLSPIEEARGFVRLIEEFKHTQDALGKVVGKSRSHVANLLRLLKLPEPVQLMVDDGRLTMGHARALVSAPDPEALAHRIVERGLTVRQAEALAGREADDGTGRKSSSSSRARKDADTLALEQDLSAALGLAVSVAHKGEAGGVVKIKYRTLEQLDDICQCLCQTSDHS